MDLALPPSLFFFFFFEDIPMAEGITAVKNYYKWLPVPGRNSDQMLHNQFTPPAF